jgi:hypothetical protein
MRHVHRIETDDPREFSIEGGCMLCGGDLAVKISATGTATVCATCRWISHPHMRRGEDGVHVIHPAGLVG